MSCDTYYTLKYISSIGISLTENCFILTTVYSFVIRLLSNYFLIIIKYYTFVLSSTNYLVLHCANIWPQGIIITVPTILQYSGPVLISLPLFFIFFSVDGALARA